MNKRLGVLCGGTGSSKFSVAISRYVRENLDYDINFVANVGDNFWFHGMYVCPDIDIATYALSGNLDESKGWGVRSDTFLGSQAMARTSGAKDWFSLGDKDTALSIKRTELMQKGWTLSSITRNFCSRLGAAHNVVPATDDSVQTFVRTAFGSLHLQEYWVKNGAKPEATGVEYAGANNAQANEESLHYCSERVFICPANPVTSIMPTLNLKGFSAHLAKAKVVAISPFIGNRPFSGPAGKLMKAIGFEPSSFGVASLYSRFLKLLFVDNSEDFRTIDKISGIGVECIKTDTKLDSPAAGKRIAKEIMSCY